MERFNRAVRRHQVARLKQKRKNYWGYGRAYGRETEVMNPAQLGKVVQYPHPCSCWMCRNNRELYGDKAKDVNQPQLEKE